MTDRSNSYLIEAQERVVVSKEADTEKLDGFRATCREHGLRITPQRTAVFEVLCRADNHPTAEDVHRVVGRSFPNISFNTVNETLLTFTEIGLTTVVETFGGPRRYDPNPGKHHHAHCVRCGHIFDFENTRYDRIRPPASVSGEFTILDTKVVMTGICKRCRAKKK